ncbi:hypothetical protein CPC08DRAFT_717178 [Agrocybe pediades]|nr:hypothetical protein CPC08DRAFT_717178 [Agrocybe pediades]
MEHCRFLVAKIGETVCLLCNPQKFTASTLRAQATCSNSSVDADNEEPETAWKKLPIQDTTRSINEPSYSLYRLVP